MLTSWRKPVLLLATGLVGLAACTGYQGQTPTCTFNVGPNGIIPEDSGCEQFAVCTANPSNPAECCVDSSGNALTGQDLVSCLNGYGAGTPTDGGS